MKNIKTPTEVIEFFRNKYSKVPEKRQKIVERGIKYLFEASKHMDTMSESVNVVHEAMVNNEKIYFIGDSDADGINTRIVMQTWAEQVAHYDNIVYDVTIRGEGYGLLKKHIDKAIAYGSKLVITADHGISAIEAVEYANKMGVTVIITDHHTTNKADTYKPLAIAIDNFKKIVLLYSKRNIDLAEANYKYIASEHGKNYYNVEMIDKEQFRPEGQEPDDVIFDLDSYDLMNPKEEDIVLHETIPDTKYIINPTTTHDERFPYTSMSGTVVLGLFLWNVQKYNIDLLLPEFYISTITDIIGIDDGNIHNYHIVACGWNMFKNPTLEQEDILFSKQYLMTFFEKNRINSMMLDVDDIGFKFGPMLNSANRIQNPQMAIDFVIENDDRKSSILYDRLFETNQDRKVREKALTDRVSALYAHTIKDNHPFVILALDGQSIHSKHDRSIMGIMSSSFVNWYGRPVMAMAYNEETNTYSGSGRSPYNVIDRLRSQRYEKFLTHKGGHGKAFGIGVWGDLIDEFKEAVFTDPYFIELYNSNKFKLNGVLVNKDCLTVDTLSEIQKICDDAEPFMEGFKRPELGIVDAIIDGFKKVGKTKNILKFNFNDIETVLFKIPPRINNIRRFKGTSFNLITGSVKFDNFSRKPNILVNKIFQ